MLKLFSRLGIMTVPAQEGQILSVDDINERLLNEAGVLEDLKYDLKELKSLGYQPFLPRTSVPLLTQGRFVEPTLGQLYKGKQLKKLIQYVQKNDAQKVFLTLVYTGILEHIQCLQDRGFTDKDLQVSKPDNSGRCQKCGVYKARIQSFFKDRWNFQAAVFREDRFQYDFDSDSILPYIPMENFEENTNAKFGKGHFGTIYKHRIILDHLEFGNLSNFFSEIIPEDENFPASIHVAVKKLTPEKQSEIAKMKRFYEKEMETLKEMRTLNHPHLIKAFAAYNKGTDRYFVFPYAKRGNLMDFWKSHQSGLDQKLVSWALGQITGIADGINKLHYKGDGSRKEGTRHGDLKPDNILCFVRGEDLLETKTLVIADVGLSKFHREYTEARKGKVTTTTQHASKLYEAPEAHEEQLPRRYDIWGLGCIFFEFVIWLLDGQKGLTKFKVELIQNIELAKFWTYVENTPQIHPVVKSWIQEILNDLKVPSAVRDLVNLIDERLLVLKYDDRAHAFEVLRELKYIQEKCLTNPMYLFYPELGKLGEDRRGKYESSEERATEQALNNYVS